MKTSKLYQVREYTGVGCSRGITNKLRSYSRARKLVSRLKARGIDAYAAPLKVRGA